MSRLKVDFSRACSRDLKRNADRRRWNLEELSNVIDLIAENSEQSIATLKQRHNMHRLSGKWKGRNECHVANAGDWLVIWSSDEDSAFLERTGTHNELFR